MFVNLRFDAFYGFGNISMENANLQILLKHYNLLLELHEKLEVVSHEVFLILQSGSSAGELAPKLKESAAVTDRIIKESRHIASMKKDLAGKNLFTASDRALVKEAEQKLTQAVNRVVEQENGYRDIIMKHGIKISRK